MATDTAPGSNRESSHDHGAVRGAARSVVRLLADLFVATAWVVFLALLFLETAWPRWTFYAVLVLGIGVYVAITAAWRRQGTAT